MSAPADARTIADIEARLFQQRLGEQRLVLARAAAMVPAPAEPPAAPAAPASELDAACAAIEASLTDVLAAAASGLHSLADCPTADALAEQRASLLLCHTRHVRELINEAALLHRLLAHSTAHPVGDVALALEAYFAGLIASLGLKLEITRAEMHHALYSPEVAAAVQRLWQLLADREQSLAREQAALDERLAIYRDAGAEFREIADAYAGVLAETERVRQDIARLAEI
ncbi:hypothetical protein GGI07_001101 [Coemansia sp. Benny D115]|nr:hypothetical protein GGI07_001101 [Coemansia sp. Benny D115]